MTARPTDARTPVPPDRERLTAMLADAAYVGMVVSYKDCQAIAAALLSPADGWREGAEAMREACALIADEVADDHISPTAEAIAAAIRALPIPSPPAEEKTP